MIVEDGIPPVIPVQVELRCSGVVEKGAALPDGRFAFGATAAGDCTLSASLPGYISHAIRVNQLPLDPRIAGLALRRDGKWEGYALSAATISVSETALATFGEGVAALRAGGNTKAALLFARAAKEDSRFAEASFQLARLRLEVNDLPGAGAAFQAAVAADPWFVSPYKPLLMLELAEERWAAARALCSQWLRVAPRSADARLYRGISALELNELAAAREDLRNMELAPDAASNAAIHYLRGRIFEMEERRADALAEYRLYLAAEPDGPMAEEARGRL